MLSKTINPEFLKTYIILLLSGGLSNTHFSHTFSMITTIGYYNIHSYFFTISRTNVGNLCFSSD